MASKPRLPSCPAACQSSCMSSTITDQLAITREEPLAPLVAFDPTTFPVLSVYLNTQVGSARTDARCGTVSSSRIQSSARTWAPSSPEPHSFDRDVDRIVFYTADKIDPTANGVAIFACWGAEEFFEAIQLTTPVSDNRVYVHNQPHLYHLAGQVEELLISGALEDSHPQPEEVEAILAPEIPDSKEERHAKNRVKRPCPICW